MALSGTLDTFALPDVLRLIASTTKSGRLRVTGDRGSGSIWVENGDIVATELASVVSQEPTDTEVVFGLLRFGAGSFTFESDVVAVHAGDPAALESVLGAAENMLVEWRSIEDVIPSLDVWVALTPELQGPDVMVDAARWRAIAAIGSGSQVGAVAEDLSLNEVDGCRLVKELVELSLVDVVDEPVNITAAGSFEPEPFADVSHDQVSEVADEPAEPELPVTAAVPTLASVDPARDGSIDPLLPAGDPLEEIDRIASDRETADVFAGDSGEELVDDLDPAEMARQLANLSPKAAKAVAAAAKATTHEERDAALAAVEAEDDTVNRGLLLKFLGSVDS